MNLFHGNVALDCCYPLFERGQTGLVDTLSNVLRGASFLLRLQKNVAPYTEIGSRYERWFLVALWLVVGGHAPVELY